VPDVRPVAPLAGLDDVAARFVTGVLTDEQQTQAGGWLDDASQRARAAAQGQLISYVEDDVVQLVARGRTLQLPQRPIEDVTAVAGLPVSRWYWNGGEELRKLDPMPWDGPVTVTYSHGLHDGEWGRELARGIVCDAVVRALLVEFPGLRSETILGRSYTLDERFRGGGAQLTEDDERRLDKAFGRD